MNIPSKGAVRRKTPLFAFLIQQELEATQIAIIKQEMNNHNSHRLGLRIGFRMAGTAFPWWNPKKNRNMSNPTNESLSGVGLWVSFAQLNEYTLSIRYTTIELFTAYNHSHTHNPLHTSLMFGEQEAAFTNLPFNLHHAVDGTP